MTDRKVLVENDTFTQTNDDGVPHIPGGGTFHIKTDGDGIAVIQNSWAFIDGSPMLILSDGDTKTVPCGCITTMYDTLQQYVFMGGKKVLVEHDLGVSDGPHTVTDSTSIGQDWVIIKT